MVYLISELLELTKAWITSETRYSGRELSSEYFTAV